MFLGICSAWHASADTYPESYISDQLKKAKTPITVDLSHMEPGEVTYIEYVDQPIWIYRRSAADIAYLRGRATKRLADPHSKYWRSSIKSSHRSSSSSVWTRLLLLSQQKVERSQYRSLKEEFLVVGGWAPRSGCALLHAQAGRRPAPWAPFLDVCSGSWFDVAGRALKEEASMPSSRRQAANFNLFLPPHHYISDLRLVIGLQPSEVIPDLDPSTIRNYIGLSPTEKLIAAAGHNDLEGVKSALQEGGRADFFMSGQGSPFDAAIIGANMEILELLVAHGARPTPNSRRAAKFVKRERVLELINDLERK